MVKTRKRKPLEPWQVDDGARLKDLWDAHKAATGASQEAFCAQQGLGTQANVGHYIHSRQGLTIDAARRFAVGLKTTIDKFSPTLAKQVNDAHLVTDLGKRYWPFPDIDRSRFDQLKDSERYEIQGLVRERLERFEAANRQDARPLGAPIAPQHLEAAKRLSEDAEAREADKNHGKKQRRRPAA